MVECTQGPYEVVPTARENNGNHTICAGARGSEDRRPIGTAVFMGKAKRGQEWNATDPEGEANAALFAASYDLLVTAELLIANAKEIDGYVAVPKKAWETLELAVKKARTVPV